MSDEKKLSERIKWKAFRLHPADRGSVVVSKATLDRWINEIAALEQRLAEAESVLAEKKCEHKNRECTYESDDGEFELWRCKDCGELWGVEIAQ